MTTSNIGDQQPVILVLASASARRLELLKQLGFDPLCQPVDADESPQTNETPDELVVRLACAKASACLSKYYGKYHGKYHGISDFENTVGSASKCIILAADTVIDLDGEILGKPRDKAHALAMLQQLSGRKHDVHTGVCVQEAWTGQQHTAIVTSCVELTNLTQSMAEKYWNTGEPEGKAGSYAIQGCGAQFVVHLTGSYSNVVGLPLYETTRLLARTGLTTL